MNQDLALAGWQGKLKSYGRLKPSSGGEPENIGNIGKSLIDSESRTPGNITNTKEGTRAWIDSRKEKAVSRLRDVARTLAIQTRASSYAVIKDGNNNIIII